MENSLDIKNFIEETEKLKIDFYKISKVEKCNEDVIPAIVQDIKTKEVLTLGYVNQIALEKSLKEKKLVLYSTSRQELWKKGYTSGNYFELEEVRVNCEQNSILYLVKPLKGGICHSKQKDGKNRETCYYRKIIDNKSLFKIIV